VIIAENSEYSKDTEPFVADSPGPGNSFSMPAFSNDGLEENMHSDPDSSDLQTLKNKMLVLEMENAEQRKIITSLQQGFNAQSAMLSNLQQLLSRRFGSAFANLQASPAPKFTFQEDTAAEIQINQYVESPDLSVEERREKKKRLDEAKKRKPTAIIMRNSNQNDQSANIPDLYFKPMADIEGDVYGDRSGICVWGFDAEFKLWFVKRRSLKVEYYQYSHDFSSWTQTDLAELVEAPYYDTSLNREAWNFVKFLENQKKKKFTGMKTANSFLKTRVDPISKQSVVEVKWPKTNQVRQIPLRKALPDGTLDTLALWTFDEATTTVLVHTKFTSIRLVDTKDLFMFRERDIKRLAATEMATDKSMFVPAAKVFVQRAKEIVAQEKWADKLEVSDVNVLFEPEA
jgi:hypothetical protein